MTENKDSQQLAGEHWAWVVRWLEIIYKDAFIHGYKHGVEDIEKRLSGKEGKK